MKVEDGEKQVFIMSSLRESPEILPIQFAFDEVVEAQNLFSNVSKLARCIQKLTFRQRTGILYAKVATTVV